MDILSWEEGVSTFLVSLLFLTPFFWGSAFYPLAFLVSVKQARHLLNSVSECIKVYNKRGTCFHLGVVDFLEALRGSASFAIGAPCSFET